MNQRMMRRIAGFAASLAVFALAISAAPAAAVTNLGFPNVPLYLTIAAKPNIIVSIDNSGSTDWEVSYSANGGVLWWNSGSSPCTLGFAGCGSDGSSDLAPTSATANSPNINTGGNFSSPWYGYTYLFPNGDSGTIGDGTRLYADTDFNNGAYAVPPIPAFGWTRSSTYNGQYFDPTQTYTAWASAGTGSFANATSTAAKSDPTSSSSVTFNLTQDYVSNGTVTAATTAGGTPAAGCSGVGSTAGASNWGFTVENGMVLPSGLCYSSGSGSWTALASNKTVGSGSGQLNLNDTTIWIRYFPATFYVPHGTNLSSYGYSTYKTAAVITTGRQPDGVTAMDGYEIKPGNFTSTTEYNNAIQNFANWFQYSRKRVLAIRGGIGFAFRNIAGMRIGMFPIDTSGGAAWSTNVTMQDFDVTAQKQALFDAVYANGGATNSAYPTGALGTPSRQALSWIGTQFRRTDASAPIIYACQANFGVFFTDGFANPGLLGSLSLSGATLNYDSTASPTPASAYSNISPFKDTNGAVSGSMGDEALLDYTGPLGNSSFTAGKVPIPAACNAANHDPSLDCNSNLHENFYGVIINTKGFVFDSNTYASANPYPALNNPKANPCPPGGATTSTCPAWNWPSSTQLTASQNQSQVDDLWHAAVNGHGLMFNAKNPKEISDDLAAVLNDIIGRTSSASSVAVNSNTLTTNTDVFQARFNSGDWSGQLLDYPVSNGNSTSGPCASVLIGKLCTLEWDAGQVLNSATPGNRAILTYNPTTRQGIPFEWASLTSGQTSLLNIDPITLLSDSNGSARLSYLRGVRTNEAIGSTPQFRQRSTVLGDIVDSAPFFVGAPTHNYGFNSYTTFRNSNQSRTPVVYVGANDGMLHGFNQNDGTEILAYVPSLAFGSASVPLLSKLTESPYVHAFTVDGSPVIDDAYFGGNWHTVLVSGLRTGGAGVFALDVTNPANFSEANAATLSMWEFTSADDADLGLTFSQPSIVKLHDGNWWAVFGNGYNSTNGKASLFLLRIDHTPGTAWTKGTDYIRIDAETTTAANGLSTPALVDLNGDSVFDSAYAGDLQGNMWKFDLSSATPASWNVAYSGTPLFKARDGSGNIQPITDQPDVGNNLLTGGSGEIVYFGTGRYLISSDNTTLNQNTQTLYAIFDENYATLPTITRYPAASSNLVAQTISRATGATVRTSTSNAVSTATKYGWYMDLIESGASSNQGERAVANPVLRNGLIFFITLIPSTDPCSFGGVSWIMELNAQNGFPPQNTVNGVSGVEDTTGVLAGLTFLANPGTSTDIALGSDTSGTVQVYYPPANGRVGRVTWRELVPQN